MIKIIIEAIKPSLLLILLFLVVYITTISLSVFTNSEAMKNVLFIIALSAGSLALLSKEIRKFILPSNSNEIIKSLIINSTKFELDNECIHQNDVDDKNTTTENSVDRIENSFNKTLKRLENEANASFRTGLIYSIFGIFFSSVGLVVWGYMLFLFGERTFESWDNYLWWSIPRISFAIAIEIIAAFFFRLYSKSIIDRKHYHNEMTNIESKMTASFLANDNSGAHIMMHEIIRKLNNTDRNNVLLKGETTVELEIEKAKASNYEALAGVLSDLSSKK